MASLLPATLHILYRTTTTAAADLQLLYRKTWGNGGGGHCLVRMEWRPGGWSVCLPLSIFPCIITSRSSLLAPAHLGGPGKRAIKRLWCGVAYRTTCISQHSQIRTGDLTTHMPLLMANSAFGLGRRRQSSPKWCYLHCRHTICLSICANPLSRSRWNVPICIHLKDDKDRKTTKTSLWSEINNSYLLLIQC